MGEARNRGLKVDFDPSIRLEFHGATLSSDGGLLAYREFDHSLELTSRAAELLSDPRPGSNTRHSTTALLRQAVYGRLAGYEDLNDADRLAIDPVLRTVVGGRAKEKQAASISQMARFETEMLVTDDNLAGLHELGRQWIDEGVELSRAGRIVLDMDSSESPTYGEQEGSAYNGHFQKTCYHPLFCFNQAGDLEGFKLRPGNVASAQDWQEVLDPILERYEDVGEAIYFRADAAFAKPEIYEYLEERDIQYVMRLPANKVLQREIKHLLRRPVGRPSRKPKVRFHTFQYQASTWSESRRVVAKVEWYAGELFPRVGFVITNLSWRKDRVVYFYNGRGTAEQWIKEGKNAVKWTRLSCHNFRRNEVRLALFALAYNLGNLFRRLVLPKSIEKWSMTTLREKVIKLGTKAIRRSRYTTFQLAEVAVPRELFELMLRRIRGLAIYRNYG